MSRIADARSRAGHRLPGEIADRWDLEQEYAKELLAGVRIPREANPEIRSIAPTRNNRHSVETEWRLVQPEARRSPPSSRNDHPPRTDRSLTTEELSRAAGRRDGAFANRASTGAEPQCELAGVVRQLFLDSKRALRSVLFCTVPGDPLNDLGWRAAELLAAQSGKQVAVVEDGSNSIAPPISVHARELITRVGSYVNEPPAAGRGAAASGADHKQPVASESSRTYLNTSGILGQRISDLFTAFDFVIVHATAPTAGELIPLSREVDGVIVLVTQQKTRCAAAEALVSTLRAASVPLLGVVFTSPRRTRKSLLHLNG